MDEALKEARKDTTRPSNVYYGLNWGYRSDNTVNHNAQTIQIERSLDTGDLLFYNYNCQKCLYPTDVLKCYY